MFAIIATVAFDRKDDAERNLIATAKFLVTRNDDL